MVINVVIWKYGDTDSFEMVFEKSSSEVEVSKLLLPQYNVPFFLNVQQYLELLL